MWCPVSNLISLVIQITYPKKIFSTSIKSQFKHQLFFIWGWMMKYLWFVLTGKKWTCHQFKRSYSTTTLLSARDQVIVNKLWGGGGAAFASRNFSTPPTPSISTYLHHAYKPIHPSPYTTHLMVRADNLQNLIRISLTKRQNKLGRYKLNGNRNKLFCDVQLRILW